MQGPSEAHYFLANTMRIRAGTRGLGAILKRFRISALPNRKLCKKKYSKLLSLSARPTLQSAGSCRRRYLWTGQLHLRQFTEQSMSSAQQGMNFCSRRQGSLGGAAYITLMFNMLQWEQIPVSAYSEAVWFSASSQAQLWYSHF